MCLGRHALVRPTATSKRVFPPGAVLLGNTLFDVAEPNHSLIRLDYKEKRITVCLEFDPRAEFGILSCFPFLLLPSSYDPFCHSPIVLEFDHSRLSAAARRPILLY